MPVSLAKRAGRYYDQVTNNNVSRLTPTPFYTSSSIMKHRPPHTAFFLRGFALSTLCLLALLTAAPHVQADEPAKVKLSKEPAKLDAVVEDGLDHLFAVLDEEAVFDVAAIAPLLDFVANQDDPKDIKPARRYNGQSICIKQTVKTDVDTILRYFYNPDIPNFLLCPSVLRLSGWREGSEFLNRSRPLWDELNDLSQPVMTRGTEFEVCTPDSFAEAYYRYDLNRLVILMRHEGKNVIVSITHQPEKSDVGRKGAILDESQWNYFYSGIEGLNRGMMGWMDTFMYSSASVQVFMENGPADTTSFLFKWVKAGWSGMNVVKRNHMYEGAMRYAESFRKVVESPSLSPEEITKSLKAVEAMTEVQTDALIRQYAENFEARFGQDPKLQKREYAKVVADGGYVEALAPDERKGVLALETLKTILGMRTLIDIELPPAQTAEVESPAETVVEPES